MNRLLKFECKKLLNRRFTAITLALLMLGIIALSVVIISDNSGFDADGNRLSGVQAIKANKAMEAIGEGEMTQEKMLEAFNKYKSVTNNPASYVGKTQDLKDEVYIKDIMPYDNILSVLRRNYSPTGTYDHNVLDDVTKDEIDRFYEIRHSKIEEIVNMDYSYGNYSPGEKEFILARDGEIQTPFYYGYTDGWSDVLRRGFYTVGLLIGLAVCIIIAPIFAYEYQTGADAVVLSTIHGKKRLVYVKIMAGFLVSTGIFILATVLFMAIFLTVYGIQGWNASFQIISLTSFYNLTILQVLCRGMVLNYLIVIGLMSITMMLSSLCKISFSAIIISGLWIFVPMFMPTSKTSRLFNSIVNLLPAKALDTYTVFSLFEVYSFGERVITLPTAILLFSALVVAVALPLAYRGFSKHGDAYLSFRKER